MESQTDKDTKFFSQLFKQGLPWDTDPFFKQYRSLEYDDQIKHRPAFIEEVKHYLDHTHTNGRPFIFFVDKGDSLLWNGAYYSNTTQFSSDKGVTEFFRRILSDWCFSTTRHYKNKEPVTRLSQMMEAVKEKTILGLKVQYTDATVKDIPLNVLRCNNSLAIEFTLKDGSFVVDHSERVQQDYPFAPQTNINFKRLSHALACMVEGSYGAEEQACYTELLHIFGTRENIRRASFPLSLMLQGGTCVSPRGMFTYVGGTNVGKGTFWGAVADMLGSACYGDVNVLAASGDFRYSQLRERGGVRILLDEELKITDRASRRALTENVTNWLNSGKTITINAKNKPAIPVQKSEIIVALCNAIPKFDRDTTNNTSKLFIDDTAFEQKNNVKKDSHFGGALIKYPEFILALVIRDGDAGFTAGDVREFEERKDVSESLGSSSWLDQMFELDDDSGLQTVLAVDQEPNIYRMKVSVGKECMTKAELKRHFEAMIRIAEGSIDPTSPYFSADLEEQMRREPKIYDGVFEQALASACKRKQLKKCAYLLKHSGTKSVVNVYNVAKRLYTDNDIDWSPLDPRNPSGGEIAQMFTVDSNEEVQRLNSVVASLRLELSALRERNSLYEIPATQELFVADDTETTTLENFAPEAENIAQVWRNCKSCAKVQQTSFGAYINTLGDTRKCEKFQLVRRVSPMSTTPNVERYNNIKDTIDNEFLLQGSLIDPSTPSWRGINIARNRVVVFDFDDMVSFVEAERLKEILVRDTDLFLAHLSIGNGVTAFGYLCTDTYDFINSMSNNRVPYDKWFYEQKIVELEAVLLANNISAVVDRGFAAKNHLKRDSYDDNVCRSDKFLLEGDTYRAAYNLMLESLEDETIVLDHTKDSIMSSFERISEKFRGTARGNRNNYFFWACSSLLGMIKNSSMGVADFQAQIDAIKDLYYSMGGGGNEVEATYASAYRTVYGE